MKKNTFWDKVSRHSKSLVGDFKNEWQYSKELSFVRLTLETSLLLHIKPITNRMIVKRDEILKTYLLNEFRSVIEKYKNCSFEAKEDDPVHAPIFVCWLQGIENAPELIKKCIASIKKNAGTHPVHILDWNTIPDYITVPSYIEEKAKNRKMNPAVFCDYVRTFLLEKYGGIWIDATIFLSKPLPESYFNMSMISATGKPNEYSYYIPNGRWTTFFIGGRKANPIFSFIRDCFEEWWSKNDTAISYLLFDYIIDLAYDNPQFKAMIDMIPLNNIHRNTLSEKMCNGENLELNECIYDDTYIYKLSWKSYYPLVKKGKKTVYSSFLQTDF